MKPMYTYQTELHGQRVTVKVYPSGVRSVDEETQEREITALHGRRIGGEIRRDVVANGRYPAANNYRRNRAHLEIIRGGDSPGDGE